MLVIFFFIVSNIFIGRTPELQGDILRADENGLNLLAVWELGYTYLPSQWPSYTKVEFVDC